MNIAFYSSIPPCPRQTMCLLQVQVPPPSFFINLRTLHTAQQTHRVQGPLLSLYSTRTRAGSSSAPGTHCSRVTQDAGATRVRGPNTHAAEGTG